MDNKLHNKICGKLFYTFFKIGAFTFGGGYAMIPLIRREIVENNKWLKEEDILDIIAIAESTPGPIAVNAATFVGYKTAGFSGALLSTIGVTLPAFMIIYILSFFLRQFQSLNIVRYAFNGISIGVLALIVNALYTVAKQCHKNVFTIVIALGAFVMLAVFKINAILALIICAAAGYVYSIFHKEGGECQ